MKTSELTGAALDIYGTTPLIAAMRRYVASKLGDEVEVPEELRLPTHGETKCY